MSLCSGLLAPGIAAFNMLMNAGMLCELAEYNDALAALCKGVRENVTLEMLLPVHYAVLCAVLCCCNRHPNIGSKERNLRQNCVSETLEAADSMLGYRSRYKAEVSYNMRADPPRPLMEKDDDRQLTTRPLRYGSWEHMKRRIEKENPGAPAFAEKDVRRPDVVIVRDPSKPPEQDNILQVVEMKFPKDTYGTGQLESYNKIDPNDDVMHLDASICSCDDDNETKRQIELITAAKELADAQSDKWKQFAWGAVTGVGIVMTVAALVNPFDGPGEVVVAELTRRAALRAAGQVAMNQGLKKAASIAAVATWGQIFTPTSSR